MKRRRKQRRQNYHIGLGTNIQDLVKEQNGRQTHNMI
jgi:hypothetical protein